MCQGVNKRYHEMNNGLVIGKGGANFPLRLLRARICPKFPASLRSPTVTMLTAVPKIDEVHRGVFRSECGATS